MKYIFIINPNAGKKKSSILIKEIEAVYKDAIIILTQKKGHATEIAKQIASSNEDVVIFACGGDGTLHEVVNGIIGYNNVKLAVIPYGTGNDFVKTFSDTLERKDFLNLKNYKNGITQACDILKVGDLYAINTASAGLDAAVCLNVDRFKGIPFVPSTMPYFMGLLVSFFNNLYHDYTLYMDGVERKKQTYSFVVACNGKHYGGGYKPCPNAKIDDGLIDICLVQNVTRLKILQLVGEYEKGTHIKEQFKKYIYMQRCKKLQIVCDKKVDVNLDGEVYNLQDPTIEIIKNCITLYLPNKMQ